ncbi:hypothetical protein OG407_09160 [Streptomyces sp. NBC_01515]|uniref:hypothetical protein n=1 Tax=Streptomyces sp. NBC_01515 TaxID=2903890 RepID=UPI003865CB6B
MPLVPIRLARRPDPLWELVCAACRLGTLVPAVGYIPDFLTPSVPEEGLPAALA